jgi:hypothetical protein
MQIKLKIMGFVNMSSYHIGDYEKMSEFCIFFTHDTNGNISLMKFYIVEKDAVRFKVKMQKILSLTLKVFYSSYTTCCTSC